MKKLILIIFLIATFLNANIVYGAEEENVTKTQDETIKEQEEALGISAFIKQAQKYTSEAFGDMDVNDLYKSALSGNINADGMVNRHFQNIRYRSY